MTKSKSRKVDGWEERYDDPYRTYQNILAKYVKRKAVDDEEKEFFAEVERMLKSGELKVLRPGEEGYDELVIERIQKKYPNNPVDWFEHRKEPAWFKKYSTDMSAWIFSNAGKSEEDYRKENKISFTYFPDEFDSGTVVVWESDKSKTFALIKFS